MIFVVFQLEDDIVATSSFATTIKTFALQQESNRWFMLEFSSLGFIGESCNYCHHTPLHFTGVWDIFCDIKDTALSGSMQKKIH